MSEDWLHQASFKTAKGTLINVRATNASELLASLSPYEEGLLPTRIANVEAALAATSAVTGSVGQVQHVPAEAQVTNPGSMAGPRIPPCPHGTRTLVRSKPGAPKAWKGYFCAAPKDASGKCDPVFHDRDNADKWDW